MLSEYKVERAKELLGRIASDFAPAAFANSFGAEDMVLTDLIAREFRAIEIFTLDTGRLPEETYRLVQEVNERYRTKVKVFFPDSAAVEDYVRLHGINGFYHGLVQRKQCCHIRKVEPLRRALAGRKAWITGLRREQAATRQSLQESEYDTEQGLFKFNPLIDWSEEDVWAYVRTNRVPYNALHDLGYPSIGCAPCTRAIKPGEDIRAGRWWWEDAEQKECGLHVQRMSDSGQVPQRRDTTRSSSESP